MEKYVNKERILKSLPKRFELAAMYRLVQTLKLV